MTEIFRQPIGVQASSLLHRPTLSTQQGGQVAVDPLLLSLWKFAQGHSLAEVEREFTQEASRFYPGVTIQPQDTRVALACLVQAGLLSYSSTYSPFQTPEQKPGRAVLQFLNSNQLNSKAISPLVSVVIVSYNSLHWLPDCLDSLVNQSFRPLEIILVDNGSSDASASWFNTYLSVDSPLVNSRLIRLEHPISLAAAINTGIRASQGDYFLLLNPDTRLEQDAVTRLVASLQNEPKAAAAATKLKLLWTPAFLNGLGNFVGAISWGTDLGLGHLDLGQFDHWQEVPSACFAGAMIRASVWKEVGPLDENLPMYYEDMEWCYRARLQGFIVLAVPDAVIYHALGSKDPGKQAQPLSPGRLERIVYGRLHFITILLSPFYWLRFFLVYLGEDLVRSLLTLLRGQVKTTHAYGMAWRKFLLYLPEMLNHRQTLQEKRKIKDSHVFQLQRKPPLVLNWHGLPLLTWELIYNSYRPFILSGKAKNFPEWGTSSAASPAYVSQRIQEPGLLSQIKLILRIEGKRATVERIGRIVQRTIQ
jgi:GT2 family glycosyltransferase